MKLKYEFEFLEIDDELVGVPLGDNADEFHGMLKLNEESKQILELIKVSEKPEEVLDKLCELHPDETKNDLAQQLCDFLNNLIREGILEP